MKKDSEKILGVGISNSVLKLCVTEVGSPHKHIDLAGVFDIKGLRDEEIARIIKNITRHFDNPSKTYFFVPRNNVIIRILDLPSVNQKEISNMIELQLERHLPYTPDEMYYDIFSVPSKKGGYSQVTLTAINRNECEKVFKIFALCGIPISCLTVNTWGIIAAYKNSLFFKPKKKKTALLIQTDADETEYVIMQGDRMVYSRSIAHDADFTVTKKQSPFVDQVVNEMLNTLDIIKKENDIEKVDIILLSPSLKVVRFNIRSRFPHDMDFEFLEEHEVKAGIEDLRMVEEQNVSLLPFCGLAHIQKDTVADLLPNDIKRKNLLKISRSDRLFFYFLLIAFTAAIVLGLGINFHAKYQYLRKLEAEVLRVDPEAQEVSSVMKKMRIVDDIKHNQIIPLEIISELYSLTPQNMFVTVFDYDTVNVIRIRGYADTLSNVSDFLLKLQKSVYFKNAEIKFAKQKQAKGKEAVDFEIVSPR